MQAFHDRAWLLSGILTAETTSWKKAENALTEIALHRGG
jgi:hypothetical protein